MGLEAVLASACGSFGASAVDTDGNDAAAEGAVAPFPPCDPNTTATDPHHCGVCGHDCLGGKCAAAACQPLIVGRTTGRIFQLAVNATYVVGMVSTGQSLPADLYACPKSVERYTCLKAHCTTFTTLKFGSYTTCRLATDGVRLFWLATDGRLRAWRHWRNMQPDGAARVHGRQVARGPDRAPSSWVRPTAISGCAIRRLRAAYHKS